MSDPEMGEARPRGADLWRAKVKEMIRAESLTQRAGSAFNLEVLPDKRLAALVLVEERLNEDPTRARMVQAVRRKKENSFVGVRDRLRNEFFYQSVTVFDWCSPKEHQSHVVWVPFTGVVMGAIFFFMAGAYPNFNTTCSERWMVTPSGLGRWLIFGNSWCLSPTAWTFDSAYLFQWGGRYAPAMKAQGHRWITYTFLHTGFPHLLSNVIVWLTAGWYTERRYGTARFLILWFIAVVFGDMFGAICEKSCVVNVGFSTGVCGIVGLFFTDLVRNWNDTKLPLIRLLLFGLLWITFVASFFIQRGQVSNYSHLGGFLCGLIPAVLFQRHLGHETLDAYSVPAAGLVSLFLVVFLPTYFYRVTFPGSLSCKGDI